MHDGTRVGEVVGKEPGEDERPAEALRIGRVARRLDEALELVVRDRMRGDAEGVDLHLANRALSVLGVGLRVRAPDEHLAGGDLHGRRHERGPRLDGQRPVPRIGVARRGAATGHRSRSARPRSTA